LSSEVWGFLADCANAVEKRQINDKTNTRLRKIIVDATPLCRPSR
jgi:hypothetical protein